MITFAILRRNGYTRSKSKYMKCVKTNRKIDAAYGGETDFNDMCHKKT